jgi:DNA polymerase III epsilon subunit-like protein
VYKRRFWVDTETTGIDFRRNFAFQMSYLIEEDNKILTKRTIEMRPDNYVDFEFDDKAFKVHGYSKEQIVAMQSEISGYQTLISDLEMFAGPKLTICGYCIDFDIKFIKALFYRNNSKRNPSKSGFFNNYFDPMPFDIMQFVQGFRIAGLLDLPSISLEKVCSHFGISTEGAHHSMIDISATKQVFDTLVGSIERDKLNGAR